MITPLYPSSSDCLDINFAACLDILNDPTTFILSTLNIY
jgi:hypothetical protein